MDIVFVQFSDQMLTPDSITRKYYAHVFNSMPGYVLPPHYYEIPYWIPVIDGILSGAGVNSSLYIATSQEGLVEFALSKSRDTIFLFSCMDANLPFLLDFASRVDRPIVIGGYTDPADFAGFRHVRYLSGLSELNTVFPGARQGATQNYRLFEGERCVPRLSLSSGCSFRCQFCTVPTKLTLTPADRLDTDVDALRPLEFELAQLDDKSFGEAANWRDLGRVRDRILGYQSRFLGFMVQTTAFLASREGTLDEWRELGVRYVEIGLEIYDDEQLKRLRKPFRTRHADETVRKAAEAGVKIVPNLIMGIPGADYRDTVKWIADHADVISAVNVNWLAVHYGNERGSLGLVDQHVGDRDQNADRKSWLSDADWEHSWNSVHEIFSITAPDFDPS